MKNKNILISYTYTPHSSSSFTLHNIKNDSRSNDPEELEVNKEDSCRIVEAGITSGWTNNTAYKSLIIQFKCWNLTNQEIMENYQVILHGKPAYDSEEWKSEYCYSKWIQDIDPEIKRKIIELSKDKFSISSISSIFEIDRV